MRLVTRFLTALAAAAALAGCPFKKSAAVDAGMEAAAPDVEAGVPAPSAANVKDIARFGDETSLNSENTDLTSAVTARVSPPNGNPVANLTRGTAVTKVAQHESYVLIAFSDPKTSGQTLLGWVPQGVLPGMGGGQGQGGGGSNGGGGGNSHGGGGGGGGGGGAADAGGGGGTIPIPTFDAGPAVHCPPGTVPLLTKLCGKPCKTNADCAGKVCVPHVPVSSPPGTFSNVCLGQ